MDYNALGIVVAFVSAQLGLSWNLHRIYLKLYSDFKGPLDTIRNKRMKKFDDELHAMIDSASQDGADLQGNRTEEHEPKTPEYPKKIKELYLSVLQVEEPQEIYTRARDSVRTAHRYFMVSGMCTFLGLIPAVFGEQQLGFLYFFFLMPLLFAIIAWDDYSGVEKEIVDLRDKGE